MSVVDSYYLLFILLCERSLTHHHQHHHQMESHNAYFKSVTRGRRYVTYPTGTAIGLLVAIALPVEVPEENLYFSLNFEANYNLPDNITQYYDSDIAKTLHGITRKRTYSILETALEIEGKNGHQCLLQTICEFAKYSMKNDGLLESVLYVVFTPSKSKDEQGMDEYYEAEIFGHKKDNCRNLYSECSANILDLLSAVE